MPMTLTEITPAECYRLLEGARFGHLACCNAGQPYVAAIYFAFSNGVAYSFTMPGKKLDWMRANDKVCLHVEHRLSGDGWTSVVVEGRFQEFPDSDAWRSERLHAWSLLQAHSDWWEIGAMKPHELPMLEGSPHVFYGIAVTAVSGRSATRTN
ncbi:MULTISPECIES: pyridoxamine 5'-phosphate oxidase family protein [unclassified Rhizobium]|uniref:pyridoxamine 5'-phosphate oxidase family protein n=1 Tax=unclassified Rhizobium TaxID=2613769 RepID=UPI0007EAB921|nr:MULTISPECIES: pyridoxamine 5'-phosphate oxidase family protein [unclassified Rhizobium]ANM13362.1 pyridoxamine 5'-phosphate oxidase-like protein [Rhizobium sp. N324]ANM19762.1 pyridoxamine 5'-phosphate oxidase-like protein [Rhizobium sp. N541]ANM26147.1 pyridoxamine 5'-phosphate oxidase-like protein [Rhizobium sp. N941]OWV89289.1 flavin-nucleotide-binding protein [Rhizobium sp. N122]OYD01152.1 pyridoxamine 5'-phosphate oxidase-like protein [Rhizobium sp. N4311]